MHDQAIRDALDEYADRHLSHTTDPWRAIGDRAKARPGKATLRHAIMLPALLLIVAFASAGALSLSRWRVFTAWEAPREILANAGLLHTIGQTQTANSYTVTLHRAYADSNIILLETSVRDQTGTTMSNLRPRWQLSDAQGNAISQQFDGGTAEVAPGVTGQYATFDAAALPTASPTLALQLQITIEKIATPSAPPAVAGNPTATPQTTGAAKSAQALATPGRPAAYNPIAAPFTFDFTVPFIQGIVVTPQQTAVAAGIPLTLRRVVATPAETRATVCYTPTAAPSEGERWLIIVDEAGHSSPAALDPAAAFPERCGILHLRAGSSRSGTHELRVSELSWGPTATETRLRGPWRFSYVLP